MILSYKAIKQISCCQGLGMGGGVGTEEFLRGMEMFCILIVVVVTQLCAFTNIGRTLLKRVNLTVCKSYLSKRE